MTRLPVIAFAALAVASAVAFFVIQHLKVTTPLLAGAPAPSPGVINPLRGSPCGRIDPRQTTMSFYLLHRADDVDVYVVSQGGVVVRTVASGRHMRRGVRTPDGVFHWDGRGDGGRVVPDGTYYFRIGLIHQGRTIQIPRPVRVKTAPPHPVVKSVSPSLIPHGRVRVTIRYAGNETRGGTIRLFRTDLPGRPRLVKTFLTPWGGQKAVWDGKIHQRLAPAGVYLVGLDVTDAACNTGRFPPSLPPAPGTTPHAGLTVRYLAAEPPLTPVQAGSQAIVYVDSRQQPYRWSLARAGQRRPVANGRSSRFALRVPIPASGAGLYELTLQTATHLTTVPLLARGARSAKILVVMPVLSWQGENPVDDDGDGVPNTLEAGLPVHLNRPFSIGLPRDYRDQAGLVRYLNRAHLAYQLTSDLALGSDQGVAAALSRYKAVVLIDERWIPSALGPELRAYVQGGGRLLSLGVDSLRREATLQGEVATDPTAQAAHDVLGAQHGQIVTANHDLITAAEDQLGIFQGTSGAFSGFTTFEPITAVVPSAEIVSQAGTAPGESAITAFRLSRGAVVEVTLAGFGSSLASNVDAQQLVDRLWSVLGR